MKRVQPKPRPGQEPEFAPYQVTPPATEAQIRRNILTKLTQVGISSFSNQQNSEMETEGSNHERDPGH